MIATFETNKDWNNLILTLEKLNWDDFEDGYTAVVARQQGRTFGNDQMKLCLTKFDNQTFVLTGLYALNPKGREYNEVLEKLLKEQKESKGYARQREPYQSRSCYACGSQDHIMRSCPVLAKAKTIRPNEKIYKRTRSALANKQCAYHGWGTHVSKECYAIKKAKEILENGKRNNDSNSPPVQVNTLKNEQLREELNEMKAQMALILEKMPNQQSNA